ncbi:MAG: TIGR00341 family protein [Candidatus Heimdallarchaeum endolithica]|uniref:TIGR00341 family protein n=1 Tax=Candidatus Heimdallarchaeum endolithica TaxID=2876572 RepID=A0A9Y1FPM7_9ARCH|nr:MAG: TIGR00341 family protein [Candidatus Heimdallarchaeum endolithica]
MKALKIIIPSEKADIVRELLTNLKIQFSSIKMENETQIELIVNQDQTSILLEELKGIGVGTVFGQIQIFPVSLSVESKVSKFVQKGKSISIDEMISNTKGLGILSTHFVLLCIFAGLLAAFGLLFDNVIIIIASMIIAPLLGPIALAVIGTLLPKNVYSKKAFLAEFIGLTTCLVIGLLVGLIIPLENLTNQITIRTSPGIPDIVFAIVSGLAAGIFIIRGESTNIVGVAVAASLCPPATNVGVLLAKQEWWMALGSFVLLILNVFSIYAACALIFWITQSFVRGGSISERQFKKITQKYYIRILAAIFLLILIIVIIILFY